MPRTLARIVGFLLAITVVVPVPSVSAQWLGLFRRQQTTVRNGRYEVGSILSDEHQRLTEMQVELALLADMATFPYEFHARANGNAFELSGYVPNDVVRQRAMDLARRTTVLRGVDALRIQPKLSVQSTLRPPSVVQQEGMQLLHKEIPVQARHMSLEARPNGVIVLTGHIDSVESKLEISKLFRRLPGCTAVINELTIEPVMLDGQRMVRVMRNNMLFLPPSALGQDQEAQVEDSVSNAVEKKTPPPSAEQQIILSPQPQPTSAPPVPRRTSNLDARQGELHLPTAVSTKQSNTATARAPEKVGDDWEAFAPSKLPVKWGRPAGTWEAQAKDLEAANSQPTKKTEPTARKQSPKPPQPPAKPQELVWMPQASQLQDKMPTPIRYVGRPTDSSKARPSASANKATRGKTSSSPNFAEARETSDTVLTWRRPGSSEESEPKNPIPAMEHAKETSDPAKTQPSQPSPGLSLQSSRRWPPAYVTGPPPSKGRPGVIVFEDDPPPKPKPNVIAAARPVAAADLQRQIKSLCGRQAREVVATEQHDGSVLVRVKVANRSIEDQLSRKILALPEMNSPRVRLLMEIEQ